MSVVTQSEAIQRYVTTGTNLMVKDALPIVCLLYQNGSAQVAQTPQTTFVPQSTQTGIQWGTSYVMTTTQMIMMDAILQG